MICYFSAGSAEDWSEDAQLFPVESLGNPLDGWEGEHGFGIRSEIRKRHETTQVLETNDRQTVLI